MAAHLIGFGPNWNGEGGLPVAPDLIDATMRFLNSIQAFNPPPAEVYPAPDGTVLMEWHWSGGAVTVVNIRNQNQVEVVQRVPGQPPEFVVVPAISRDRLERWHANYKPFAVPKLAQVFAGEPKDGKPTWRYSFHETQHSSTVVQPESKEVWWYGPVQDPPRKPTE